MKSYYSRELIEDLLSVSECYVYFHGKAICRVHEQSILLVKVTPLVTEKFESCHKVTFKESNTVRHERCLKRGKMRVTRKRRCKMIYKVNVQVHVNRIQPLGDILKPSS